MAKEKEQPRTVKTVVRVPFEMAMGPTLARYYEAFKEEKILGTKCKKCGRILVPARPFCPRCFEPMEEWVEASDTGTITSTTIINYTYFGVDESMLPLPVINLRLDGTDCDYNVMGHVTGLGTKDVEEISKRVKVGARVRAVWRKEKEGNPDDIESWELIE
jgi:hypothetical protein